MLASVLMRCVWRGCSTLKNAKAARIGHSNKLISAPAELQTYRSIFEVDMSHPLHAQHTVALHGRGVEER